MEEREKKDRGYDEPCIRICQRKKMGVKTNNGLEFAKKKMGLRATKK